MFKIVFICFIGVFFSCSSLKSKATMAGIDALKEDINTKRTTISFNWARPIGLGNTTSLVNLLPPGSTLNAINLIGNSNFYKLNNDSIHVDLPYFGRQFYADYSTDNGISFKGIPKQTKSYTNIKKGTFITTHVFTNNGESFTATLTFFTNNTCRLHIISNKRTAVVYDGNWSITIKLEQAQANIATLIKFLKNYKFILNNSVSCIVLFYI